MPKQPPSPPPEKKTTRNSSHASSACEGCRARKIKCDETRPACNACLKRGTPCTWTVEKDRRTARGRACQDCEPLGAENARLNAEVARLLAENEALKAQLANRTQAEHPALPQTESVTESPPKTPDALQGPFNMDTLFAQFPWATANDTASLFPPPSFAPEAHYRQLSELSDHGVAHPELTWSPSPADDQALLQTMDWDEALRVFDDEFGRQLLEDSAWPIESF